jgi:hypothetical protein
MEGKHAVLELIARSPRSYDFELSLLLRRREKKHTLSSTIPLKALG